MDEQTFLLFIVVVQARFDGRKNVIWLEGNHVMEETSEFVYFWLNLNLWSGIYLHCINVRVDHIFELVISLIEVEYVMLLLKDL